jgi:fucose permease
MIRLVKDACFLSMLLVQLGTSTLSHSRVQHLICHRLEFVVWFAPSLIGDAVAVAIVGMLLGPIYPIVMNQSSKILPRWLLTGSIGWIAGFGQAGSAILPFMTGALASKVGIENLQPL